jgi:hypothetical protein
MRKKKKKKEMVKHLPRAWNNNIKGMNDTLKQYKTQWQLGFRNTKHQ